MSDLPRPMGSRYLLVGKIGEGSTGTVYLATMTGAGDGGERVAVKVLHPHLSSDTALVRGFLEEHRVLVTLRHPRLASMVDLVVEDGRLAIVMELVTGGDLRKLLEGSGGLRPHEAFRLAAQTAEALAYVHEAGVVHRDVKPENVLLQETAGAEPDVRLTDFGIAAVGTPQYMAPELARDAHASAGSASDVYALGCVLYEMLTGRPPFESDYPAALLWRHANQAPAHIEGLPSKVDRLLSSMLDKEAGRRPSAADAARALDQFSRRYVRLPHLVADVRPAPEVRVRSGPEPVPAGRTLLRGDPVAVPAAAEPVPLLERRRRNLRPFWIGAGGVVAVAVAVGLAVAGYRATRPPPTATLPTVVTHYPAGLTVERRWQLVGKPTQRKRLRVTTTLTATAALPGGWLEVKPPSVGAEMWSANAHLAKGRVKSPAHFRTGYQITVARSANLRALALEQAAAEQHRLVAQRPPANDVLAVPLGLSFDPAAPGVAVGSTTPIAVLRTFGSGYREVVPANQVAWVTSPACHVVVPDDPAVQTAAALFGDAAGTCDLQASSGDQRATTQATVT